MADREPQAATTSRNGVVRWWDLLIAFFGGNIVGAVLGVGVALIFLLVAVSHGFRPTRAGLAHAMQSNFLLLQLLLVASDAGWLGGVWLVARWRFDRPLARFFPPVRIGALALAVFSGALLSALTNLCNALLESTHVVVFHPTNVDRMMVPHAPLEAAFAALTVVLLAPFVEEFFFRGLFFAWLRRRFGAWPTVLVTSLVFALLHGHVFIQPGVEGLLETAELFAAGVLLGFWVEWTGSLRSSFAMHAAYNGASLLLSVLLP